MSDIKNNNIGKYRPVLNKVPQLFEILFKRLLSHQQYANLIKFSRYFIVVYI